MPVPGTPARLETWLRPPRAGGWLEALPVHCRVAGGAPMLRRDPPQMSGYWEHPRVGGEAPWGAQQAGGDGRGGVMEEG